MPQYQYKREPLNTVETNQIMNACQNHREKLIIWTLLETGMRVSELVNLKKENIEWQEGRIIIFGKGGPFGKKTKRRVIPMSEKVRILLSSHFATNDTIGMTARTAQNLVKRVANRANITKPVTPHVLRHTFAVNWIKKGGSVRILQLMLGHDDIQTTMIYLNISPEEVCIEFKKRWE